MKYQSSLNKAVYEMDFDTSKPNARYVCPECTVLRKNKKAKDMQYYPKSSTAYCFHCEVTLFEYKPYEPQKQYIVPKWENITNLSDKAVKWFNSRMIKQETLNLMGVSSKREYMPQFNKEVEVICFPMVVNGVVKNIKYRGAKKSFKLYSGAELVWYNYDCIKDSKEIIIVEGEMDLLTFIQNGFNNVISVPNGANKNLEYLDSSIYEFDHVEKIYLATDQDSKGIELRYELVRRFGANKCNIINFKQYKDANDYYCSEGELFKDLIKNSKPVPIKGAVRVDNIHNEIIDLYENGVKEGERINELEVDEYITWELGRLAIVTGVPSSGKSEVVDWIVSKLNLNLGWKAAYFSPENYPLKYHYAKIHEKYSGTKFKKETDSTDFLSIYEYVKNNYFYILNEDDMSIDKVLEIAFGYIKSNGIKILVIDPYNVLEHNQARGENETQYISKFLDKLLKFTRFNNILTFLIAHPRKMEQGKTPTLYDISGSANFYNKTDYGFTVDRSRDDMNIMTNNVNVYWQKIKFKHLGKQGVSELKYNINNGRLQSVNKENWDNSNWLGSGENIDVNEHIEPAFEPNLEFDQITETDAPF